MYYISSRTDRAELNPWNKGAPVEVCSSPVPKSFRLRMLLDLPPSGHPGGPQSPADPNPRQGHEKERNRVRREVFDVVITHDEASQTRDKGQPFAA